MQNIGANFVKIIEIIYIFLFFDISFYYVDKDKKLK